MTAISTFFDGMHGVIFPFGGTTAPPGFLMCDGEAVSRTTYAALFAVIGTTFGEGDGSTTFNVPDLRGEFMRGADGGRGVDAGRVLGSAQQDAFQGHYHDVTKTTAPWTTQGLVAAWRHSETTARHSTAGRKRRSPTTSTARLASPQRPALATSRSITSSRPSPTGPSSS